MKAETWMSPTEAVSEGLADEVIQPERSRTETQDNWAEFIASAEIDGQAFRPSKIDWDKFLASTEIQ